MKTLVFAFISMLQAGWAISNEARQKLQTKDEMPRQCDLICTRKLSMGYVETREKVNAICQRSGHLVVSICRVPGKMPMANTSSNISYFSERFATYYIPLVRTENHKLGPGYTCGITPIAAAALFMKSGNFCWTVKVPSIQAIVW